jgi:glycosidase
MNTAAIYHLANLEDSYALTQTEAVVRLRAAQGDLRTVTLVAIDKYRHLFHDDHVWQESEMRRVASDGQYDFFEAVIHHDTQLIDYYFRLQSDKETTCLGNGGFFDEPDLHDWLLYSFPNLKADDLFELPEWTRSAVIYQIFPDSFYRGDGKGFEGWYRGPRDGDDHLGGTVQGIIDKLDYIESLGANVLYMTPVFNSPANHKYHTTDYFEVDPRFGTKEQFAKLVELAHARGMRVLLDGVFHSPGLEFFAFQDTVQNGPDSAYWDWFLIEGYPVQTEYPINYRAWGHLREMPNFNLDNPEVVEYLLDVLVYWVQEMDTDGWRLDTVDKLSHTFLREARRRLRAVKHDCVLAGELWYDARPWLQGDTLDTVMNYPFCRALTAFLAEKEIAPSTFSQRLGWVRGRYRYQAWQGLWNLLSSHDIRRFFSAAEESVERTKLAVLFQFTYPGTPFLFAGDELGMTGNSLDCRYGLYWDEARQQRDLLAFYRLAGRLRRENPALRHGDFQEILISDQRGLYGFARRLRDAEIQVILNVSPTEQIVDVPEGSTDLLKDIGIPGAQVALQPDSAIVLHHRAGP